MPLCQLLEHRDWIYGLAVHPLDDVFASASDDHTIRIWNKTTYECIQVIECGAIVETVCFGPAQDTVIAGLAFGAVTAFNMRTGQPIKTYSSHLPSKYVYGLAISPYDAHEHVDSAPEFVE